MPDGQDLQVDSSRVHGAPAAPPGTLFDLPEDITYLNCANLAPQLRAVAEAGSEALRAGARPWTRRSEDWFAPSERLRDLFGSLVGADADGVALVPGVSYGIALAAANLPVERGQSLVVLEDQYPSNVYAWRDVARRRGARVVTAGPEPGESWTDAVIRSIADDTAVVAVPNCHWTDGSLIDLASVSRAVRSRGAALVVDASQSLGAYPLDVGRVRPDFLVTVGYKWLLGPYGLAYLYVAPEWREKGVPLENSWLSREGSEDFARLVEYTDVYRSGARRFDGGEFPQFVTTPMAIAALEQVHAWGVSHINDRLSRLTAHAAAGTVELGGSAPPKESRAGHMVGLRFPGGLPTELPGRLSDANVYVGIRGDAIRVAPHLHASEGDIDRLLDVVRRCRRGSG